MNTYTKTICQSQSLTARLSLLNVRLPLTESNADNIAEEIADVEIMLKQLQIIFNNRNDVNRFYELKIKRLKNNLRRSKNDL